MALTLVINCGSSSLKFALLNPQHPQALRWGLADRLLEAQPTLSLRSTDASQSLLLKQGGHQGALQGLLQSLDHEGLLAQVHSVGHRVVHGGEAFKQATLITPEVLKQIEACIPLAPLHNPANLQGIRAAQEALPHLPQVAVFDTAFHQSMPAKAYHYALPNSLYQQHGVRRYGFHGTSHQYVCQQAAQMLGQPLEQTQLISAHLGNGASVTAVAGGQSRDTSMGLTPLEGLVMGTRSGDIDPNLHLFISERLNLDLAQVTELLNKQSGLLGLSGLSNDCRTLEAAAQQGHAGAQLALEVFCYRLAKYIAAMTVALDGPLDALIFTGGIGENSHWVRHTTVAQLRGLGLQVNTQANQQTVGGQAGVIGQGPPAVLVVPTNEERMIAWQTQALLAF